MRLPRFLSSLPIFPKIALNALPEGLASEGNPIEKVATRSFQVASRGMTSRARAYIPCDVRTIATRFNAMGDFHFNLVQVMENDNLTLGSRSLSETIIRVGGHLKDNDLSFVVTDLQVGGQSFFPTSKRVSLALNTLAAYTTLLRTVDAPEDPIAFVHANHRFMEEFGSGLQSVRDAQTRAAYIYAMSQPPRV